MLPEAPLPASVSTDQNIALTCYLNAMLAMAKSMRTICSRAGLVYGDRLMRLPRRLGFDATPQKLDESCDLLETDLAEYTEATTAWLDTGSGLAREILAITSELDPCTNEGQNLHAAMLEDLAEQMAASAEIDADSDLRPALKRYALALRGYLQRRRLESRSSLVDLQCRADQLAKWLARADPSNSTDVMTGLPNRPEFERQLEASWHAAAPLSALLFEWKPASTASAPEAGHAIAKQLADRLADLVRPRDIIGRWSSNQFAVIFECSAREAALRAAAIAEWLTTDYSAVINGDVAAIHVVVTVSLTERLPEETPTLFVQRIGQPDSEPLPSLTQLRP
jgi:GGDEF domain-containing protein